MSQEKKVNKSKEQIAFEMKQQQNTQRKRKFITEVFFPLLQKHTKNIHQAKNLCKVIQNDILSTFNLGMSQPISSLKMEEKLEGEDESVIVYREFLNAFKDVSIAEAAELIGGMPQAIEGALSIEDRNRSLSEIEWTPEGSMNVLPKKPIEKYAKEAFCNDFRQLSDGKWIAYSTKVDAEGTAIRGTGINLFAALEDLKQKLV